MSPLLLLLLLATTTTTIHAATTPTTTSLLDKIKPVSKHHPLPVLPQDKQSLADKAINVAFDPMLYMKSVDRFSLVKMFNPTDPTSASYVHTAATSAFLYGATPLKDETVMVVCGLGNIGPSPAFVTRLSRMFKRVILAFSHPGFPSDAHYNKPYATKEFGGNNNNNNVYAIGVNRRIFLDEQQATDALIHAFRVAHQHKAVLGGDDILTSGVTLFGHSLGSVAAPWARKLLNDAGLHKAVRRVVTVGGIVGMHKVRKLGGVAIQGMYTSGLLAIMKTVVKEGTFLDSVHRVNDFLKASLNDENKALTRELESLVDVALAGRVGPWRYDELQKYVRPQYRMAANGASYLEAVVNPLSYLAKFTKEMVKGGVFGYARAITNTQAGGETDGSVEVDSQLTGKQSFLLRVACDHLYEISAFEVVDDFVSRINPSPQSPQSPQSRSHHHRHHGGIEKRGGVLSKVMSIFNGPSSTSSNSNSRSASSSSSRGSSSYSYDPMGDYDPLGF